MPRSIMEPADPVTIETERLAHEAEASTRGIGFNALLTGILLLFRKGGVDVAARPAINLLESSDIGWTVADDNLNNEAEVTPTLKPTTVTPAAYTSANITVDANGRITAAANGGTGGFALTDGDKGDIVVSSSGTVWAFDSAVVTAAGRAILDDANAAAQRTTLGLGTTDSPTFQALTVENATAATQTLKATTGTSYVVFIFQNAGVGTIGREGSAGGQVAVGGTANAFVINQTGAFSLELATGNTVRWRMTSAGHLLAAADNTYDIGAVGATRPRNLYVAGTGIYGGMLTALGLNIPWVTPAQITANQNDYNPGTGSAFRLSSDASRNITGFAGGVDGREIWIVNVGAQNIVLTNQDALSAAASRIITGTGASVTLAADDTAVLKFDGTTSRWRLIT